ncbi:Fatty acid hydroxylase family (carotene hydroxylase/sterol desaturase) [hydrothermal vent metagenome]|uniref:Fatty acid hydroxylase family (Carotene hydroxylase/sterol desaturase) n=1 Tax=hydrothermal vent metagenome TaxID=652676 RepID=A0A3B0WVG4_9ZZZZ
MTEFLYQNEASIRLSIFLSSFVLLAIFEHLKPKRPLTQPQLNRWANNFALLFSGTLIVRILLPAAAIGIAYLVERQQWGLVNHVDWPFWVSIVFSFIILDLAIYVQHILFHVLPLLWRVHRVHHSDLDCDTSTGLRFHPLEILMSILIKFITISVLGAPVIAVILFEITLNLLSMFTHSNLRLNKTFERVLRWFIVTPDMHRVHHSIRENETNSNFAFHLSIWDRLFGTYIAQPADGQLGMTIGLEPFRENHWQTFRGLLLMPFDAKIKGYAINDRDTKNADALSLAREVALQNQEKARLSTELSSYIQAIDQHALVSVTNAKGEIIRANKKFCDVSGYSEEELIGKDHRLINSGTHPASTFKDLWKTIASGKKWQGEICNRAKDGSLYWVDNTIIPALDEHGKIDRYISVRIDISDRKRHEAELKKAYDDLAKVNAHLETISRTDALTQIANRRYFDEVLANDISKLSRTNGEITLMLCDIDYFKKYNDTYGHPAGDAALQQVAQAIESSFSRAGDLVARYGGEEFAIILVSINKQTALKLAERMRHNIEALKLEHCDSDVNDVVTISVGVTTLPVDQQTSSAMVIEKVDKALYKAKESGRNNVQFIN